MPKHISRTLGRLGIRAAAVAVLLWTVPAIAATEPSAAAPSSAPAKPSTSTVDHKKLKELQQDFATGPDVTKACLACHTEASKQIHKTTHWTWDFKNPQTGQQLGKKHVINNFCVALGSNEPRCTSCHVGYGWKDNTFDFANEAAVDCLACHDTTGKYKKFPTGAGHPNYQPAEWPPKSGNIRPPVDLKTIAQHVGKTSRATCGECHFYGGGGNAVKHGDIDTSLFNPDKKLDVHMDAKGLNFSCSTCHGGPAHQVQGSRYTTLATDTKGIDVPGRDDGNRSTCQSCHGDKPMKDPKLNEHTDKVACQTCHIPAYARGGIATKMWWDWSTAGKRNDKGVPIVKKDAKGNVVYDGQKGDFVWAENVKPTYAWYNGTITYTLKGQAIDPTKTVDINTLGGSAKDPGARIWPVKVFEGIQPIDAGRKVLAVPHTFGNDDSAYWKNYDWPKAVAAGMKSVGEDFSGQLGFVKSRMVWPITHMVAPAKDTVGCNECHSRDGRLADVEGVYMPGRDHNKTLDLIGFGLALASLGGVVVHGGIRVLTRRKKD